MSVSGSNTANFSFAKLGSNDKAGYSTINELIDSIDTVLNSNTRLLPSTGLVSTQDYVLKYNGSAAIISGLITAGSIASDAVTTAKILDGNVTVGKLASTLDLSSKTVTLPALSVTSGMLSSTLDLTGKTVTVATATAGNNTTTAASTAFVTGAISTAVAGVTAGTSFTVGGDLSGTTGNAQIVANAIGTTELANANVTYAKLASDAKTYSIASTATTGVYFTASGDFTSASVSSASSQNPFVIANHASTGITLSLPNTIGSTGDTINVCQTGAAAVTISPKTGATATINGSTSTTYTLGGQYSVVTLICLSNSGSNGTWVITGDYY